MKKLFILLSVIVLVSSCQKDDIPKPILPNTSGVIDYPQGLSELGLKLTWQTTPYEIFDLGLNDKFKLEVKNQYQMIIKKKGTTKYWKFSFNGQGELREIFIYNVNSVPEESFNYCGNTSFVYVRSNYLLLTHHLPHENDPDHRDFSNKRYDFHVTATLTPRTAENLAEWGYLPQP